MSVVFSQPGALRVWTMTRQIGAESAGTAARRPIFPAEAGGEGILLVSCAAAASERVHASATYFDFPAWMAHFFFFALPRTLVL